MNQLTLLGIEIDNKLNFGKDVPAICKKANNQLNAISRISAVLWQKEKEILINSFAYSSSTANLLYDTLQPAKGLKK